MRSLTDKIDNSYYSLVDQRTKILSPVSSSHENADTKFEMPSIVSTCSGRRGLPLGETIQLGGTHYGKSSSGMDGGSGRGESYRTFCGLSTLM